MGVGNGAIGSVGVGNGVIGGQDGGRFGGGIVGEAEGTNGRGKIAES